MIIHDNGKICILSAHRCGHTSMYGHFGLSLYSNTNDLDVWLNSTSRRVVVLRNPYDRYMSAYNASLNRNDAERWMRFHTLYYIQKIPRNTTFDIIDFYKLPLYINKHGYTITTNTENVSWENVPNTEEMREEYLAYKYFMENRAEITPEEWQELTVI